MNYSPSNKKCIEKKVAEDYSQLSRHWKLEEYSSNLEITDDQVHASGNNQSVLVWQNKNPNSYRDKVQNGTSEGLLKSSNDCLKSTIDVLQHKRDCPYNNLTQYQCAAIPKLSWDKSIVMKPSDKCRWVLVIDTTSYKEACQNQEFNKEVSFG